MRDDTADEVLLRDLQDDTGRGMVEGFARVVALEGDIAWLEIEPSSACGSCGARAGCGVPRRLKGRSVQRFALPNDFEGRLGERIVVGIPQKALLRASAIAYLLPLIAMIGAAVLAGWLGYGDGGAALAALGGLAGGFVLAHSRARQLSDEGALAPVYLRPADGHGSLHCGVRG